MERAAGSGHFPAGGTQVQLDGVAVRYGSRQPWVVRDVTMTIRPGRLVRLDGVNGSGKSTLLRVIAGAAIPTAGKITGRPVTGYVPERFPPALPFSAREYLTHLGGMYRIKGAALLRRIDECLARLGASEHADMPFRNLSQGMCQKAAVAQALLPGPGLLVLDEAWTALDAAARGPWMRSWASGWPRAAR
jgi:ABC-type multidrug transport system ATPase subunit